MRHSDFDVCRRPVSFVCSHTLTGFTGSNIPNPTTWGFTTAASTSDRRHPSLKPPPDRFVFNGFNFYMFTFNLARGISEMGYHGHENSHTTNMDVFTPTHTQPLSTDITSQGPTTYQEPNRTEAGESIQEFLTGNSWMKQGWI